MNVTALAIYLLFALIFAILGALVILNFLRYRFEGDKTHFIIVIFIVFFIFSVVSTSIFLTLSQ